MADSEIKYLVGSIRLGYHAPKGWISPYHPFQTETAVLTPIYPVEWLRDSFLDGHVCDLPNTTECESDSPPISTVLQIRKELSGFIIGFWPRKGCPCGIPWFCSHCFRSARRHARTRSCGEASEAQNSGESASSSTRHEIG